MSLTPSSEQRRILELGPTTIRIRAGAGTGKTTTVALAVANLVAEHGIEPERILGITFTNKAAAELAQRVGEFLPDSLDESRQVEIHTYHGFAAQVLAEFGILAGVDVRAGVITPTFSRQLVRDVFLHEPHTHLDMTNLYVLDKVRRLGDQLGDHLLRPEDLAQSLSADPEDGVWAERLEMVDTLIGYNEAKAELGVVDYADLVTFSTRIVTDHPALAATIRDRYEILVLDEYQDTNPAQRVLMSTIFGGGFPVIAVGDEDQTIYEWRGASAENFERFGSQFRTRRGSPAHEQSLTLNRRSGPSILAIANDVRQVANPAADRLLPARETPDEVRAFWAADALAEAEWVARELEALHEGGTPWSEMAVLFRKNKDFSVFIDVLGRHDIPIEVANVGGLLSVPEISHLRAWLTVLANPEDSSAVAQILMGSSYRLGLADLAALTKWLSRNRPDTSDSDELHPITLIEATEATDAIEGLTDQASRRLRRFHATYTELLVETQGMSLAETCRMVLDRTRAWQDADSLPLSSRLTARLNLYRFLDLADDWSPLSGRPSVDAFLDYLTMMEDEPAEELDSARLSGEEAVTLVTVHRAKGLEWDVVCLPGLYKGNFPAGSGGFPDPVRFAHHLPPEFRLDASLAELPDDDSGRSGFFRTRHTAQEWRTAYVAVTRARRALLVSGAYWYGLPEPRITPAEPSPLFELIADHPACTRVDRSPLGPRPDMLRSSDEGQSPDPHFDDGWQEVLRIALEEPEGLEELAESMEVAKEFREWAASEEQRLFELGRMPVVEPEESAKTLSVTGLVTYAQCPLRYYWSEIDPLPRRLNPAAARGTQIHRQIELHQLGHVPFEDLTDDLYDSVGEQASDAVSGYRAYEESRFAESRAALIEAPFTFELTDGYQVRGRIDAIYADEGRWEIVDFKSGRPSGDPSRVVQLQAYAVAAADVDFGIQRPNAVDVTFAYLGDGLEEVTHEADAAWLAEARSRLGRLTRAIDDGDFQASPGPWCQHCDFIRFCGAGKEEISS